MQVLVNHRTEDTLALLMRLCTQGDPSQGDADYIAELSEFAALYSYKCALCWERRLPPLQFAGFVGHDRLCRGGQAAAMGPAAGQGAAVHLECSLQGTVSLEGSCTGGCQDQLSQQ